MNKTKAQMELLGLAIVVVLLIIGLLFVAGFLLNKQPSQTRKRFVESEGAASMLSALLQTNLQSENCNAMTIADALTRCASGSTLSCTSRTDPSETKEVCQFTKDQIQTIFQNTLDVWNTPYFFDVRMNDNQRVDGDTFDLGPCTDFENRDRSQKIQPLPSSPPINVRLIFCS